MLKTISIRFTLAFIAFLYFIVLSSTFAQGTTYQNDNNPQSTQGILCIGKLGDYIWHDKNVDGIQDEDELGIEGVIVELLDSSTTLINTTVSDPNGIYLFTDVYPGKYSVKISDSNFENGGVFQSVENKDWYISLKENGEQSTLSVAVDLGDEEKLDIDFGFFYTCMILHKTGPDSAFAGDVITYDFKVENCGDVVLHGGVSVYDSLINPEGDHQINHGVVQPRTTWEFSATYVSSQDDCGDLINNAWAIGHPVMPDSTTLPTVRDEDSWKVEIICDYKSSLGDKVWNDENKNGLQELNEDGIANVEVKLFDKENTLIKSVLTDKDGYYLLEKLLPAEYYLQFIQPDGYVFTQKNQGSDKDIDSDADEVTGKTDLISL
ncbi:MAG: SdrD B-like domain-containing protein, partial [Bacteroidota bacterium]